MVKIDKSVDVPFENGQMVHGGSSAIAVYNTDQKSIISKFKEADDFEKDALYLFFVDNVKGKTGDVAGFMPLQRQAGFIYDSPNLFVVAHELAHGAFNLRHTFSPEEFIAAERTTKNLMDYTGSTELWKNQWGLIHDPENMLFAWAQDEAEGEMSAASTLLYSFDEQSLSSELEEEQNIDPDYVQLLKTELELKDSIVLLLYKKILPKIIYNGNEKQSFKNWVWRAIYDNISIMVGYSDETISINPLVVKKMPKRVLVYPNGYSKNKLKEAEKKELTKKIKDGIEIIIEQTLDISGIPNPTDPISILETGLTFLGVESASLPLKVVSFVLIPKTTGLGASLNENIEVEKRIIQDQTLNLLQKIFKGEM